MGLDLTVRYIAVRTGRSVPRDASYAALFVYGEERASRRVGTLGGRVLDAVVDLFAVDGDGFRCLDAAAYLVAVGAEHNNLDVVADSDGLSRPSGEDEHSWPPCGAVVGSVSVTERQDSRVGGQCQRLLVVGVRDCDGVCTRARVAHETARCCGYFYTTFAQMPSLCRRIPASLATKGSVGCWRQQVSRRGEDASCLCRFVGRDDFKRNEKLDERGQRDAVLVVLVCLSHVTQPQQSSYRLVE